MNYSELPPKNPKDKKFVDEMVNTYLELIIMEETINRMILALEQDEPTPLTHVSIEACYKMMEEREQDKKQVSSLVMNGKFDCS